MSSTRLSLLGDRGGEFTLSSLDVLQRFSFFLQMGFTLILATLDGLDVGLLGDVIKETVLKNSLSTTRRTLMDFSDSRIESKNSSENIPNELKESTKVKESSDVLLVKKLVSDDKLEKKTVVPTDAKIQFVKAKQQEKLVRKPVKYAEMYSGEDRLKIKELMELCTKLSNRVLDLEKTKTAQENEIADLKKRVKKLERKRRFKKLKVNTSNEHLVLLIEINAARNIRKLNAVKDLVYLVFRGQGGLVEHLVNYHLKELRCSAQCHTKKWIWINSRGDVRRILLVSVQAVAAADNSPAVPEHTTVERPMNMSPENKAHFE
uniref:Uncharacterized protein n=1 Tax=Tanacetum cinerariifolium TaxID=118510 RepID=A0A6L2M5Y6_TANCI|nr:hypothetical protein [Tanacetum cinerariifolium]